MARAAGCLVVDDSSAFRQEADVPLVVPEVNGAALDAGATLVANPNSMAIALALALKPLHAAAGLARVVVSTYQAVSGAGHRGVEQLQREAADLMNGREPPRARPDPPPHRLQPGAAGRRARRRRRGRGGGRLARETRQLLGLPGLALSATAVRVPVFYGHAAAVHVGFDAAARPRRRRARRCARPRR